MTDSIAINNDLEDIIGNHEIISPEKSDNGTNNTKRRLDYNDASDNGTHDEQEEIITLTPNILEESKVYEKNYSRLADQMTRKSLKEEQRYINITNETAEYVDNDPSQSTPSGHK